MIHLRMYKKQKLELTWIGKENRPRLVPRILLEDTEKSYHAKYRVKEQAVSTAEKAKSTENSGALRSLRSLQLNDPGDLFDNRLIFGDNLLALKALEQEFTAQIKEAQRAATVALTLKEKLTGQKQIKALEARRSQKRRTLFDARDAVENQRKELIRWIEGKLQQPISVKNLFAIRWQLG